MFAMVYSMKYVYTDCADVNVSLEVSSRLMGVKPTARKKESVLSPTP